MLKIAAGSLLILSSAAFSQFPDEDTTVEYVWVARDGSGDYLSIQAAIDDFTYGTVIRVKPGTYRENLVLQSWVTIEGIGKVIVEAASSLPAISGLNLMKGRLENLTISGNRSGSGVFLLFSKVEIDRCIFLELTTAVEAAKRSHVTLSNSVITDSEGPGILLDNRSSGKIEKTQLRKNGIGIRAENDSNLDLDGCTIADNAGDGLVLGRGTYGTLLGNVIAGNGGNGIYLQDGSIFVIKNNTIVDNGRDGETSSSAGINLNGVTSGGIINNIVIGNLNGILNRNAAEPIEILYNNVWNNKKDLLGVESDRGLSSDPHFLDPKKPDYRLKEGSPSRKVGQDSLDLGAFYDSGRLMIQKRVAFLKSEVKYRLRKRKWLEAFKIAQQILTQTPGDSEAEAVLKKAGHELSMELYESAKRMYRKGDVKIARNLLEMGFGYDQNNSELNELRNEIDSKLLEEEIETYIQFFVFVALGLFAFFYIRRRRKLNDDIALVKIWSDDAEELYEKGKFLEAEKYATAEYLEAGEKLRECMKSLEAKNFPYAEVLAKESVKWSERAIEKTNQFKQLRKDAVLEVSQAETQLKEFTDRYPDVIVGHDLEALESLLRQSKHNLIGKEFKEAKESAEELIRLTRRFEENIFSEKQAEIAEMIRETEDLLVSGLASNNSPDIVSVLIDLKAELSVVKQAFENEQISSLEASEQVAEIRELALETVQLSGEERTSGSGKKNYYEILGVKEDATPLQIKNVYRKLSMIYHPDQDSDGSLGIDSDERFKEIKEAYEILSNSEKRARYDLQKSP